MRHGREARRSCARRHSSPRPRSSSRSSSSSGSPGAIELSDPAEVSDSFGSPGEIGELFLTDHLLAFEITSIVLLVAAIGGVVLGTTLERDADSRESQA